MERKKELFRLAIAFMLALTLGFWLSDWMNTHFGETLRDTGRTTDKAPLNTLPFDEDQSLPAENAEEPSQTRPLKKSEPKKLIVQAAPITTSSIQGITPLSPQDKALLKDKGEFMDNETPIKKEEDSGEDFFDTKYDLGHLVDKSLQSKSEQAFRENMGKIIEAQSKLNPTQDSLSDLNRYQLNNPNTQRFAIKLQLPESDSREQMQLKFQYREAPQFGASAQMPELILPQVTPAEEGFFKVERSKTSESPWNNFDPSPYGVSTTP